MVPDSPGSSRSRKTVMLQNSTTRAVNNQGTGLFLLNLLHPVVNTSGTLVPDYFTKHVVVFFLTFIFCKDTGLRRNYETNKTLLLWNNLHFKGPMCSIRDLLARLGIKKNT